MIVTIILVLVSIAFVLGNIGRLQLENNIAIHLLDIAVVFIVFLWLGKEIFQGKLSGTLRISITKPLLLFAASLFLSLLVNIQALSETQILVSFLYLLRLLLYFLLFFAVYDLLARTKKKVALFLTFSGVLIVLAGYVQYFFYPSLRNLYYAGWDEHLYRMFSVFLDPNFAGIFFVLFFIFLLGQAASKAKDKAKKLLFFSFALITIPAIFLTYSRSAFVMLVVSTVVFLALIRKVRLIGFALLVFALILLVVSNSNVEGLNPLRTASSLARLETSQNALIIFQGNPFFGVGFNAYRYGQQRYGFREKKLEIESHADGGTDNSYLFVLATSGIVGFSAFTYLLWSAFSCLKRELSTKQKMSAVVTLSSFAGVCVASLFINAFFYPFILFWLFVLLGITLRK